MSVTTILFCDEAEWYAQVDVDGSITFVPLTQIGTDLTGTVGSISATIGHPCPGSSWECVSGGCEEIAGNAGEYPTELACQSACGSTWNCLSGDECEEVVGQFGEFETQEDCELECVPLDCCTAIPQEFLVTTIIIGEIEYTPTLEQESGDVWVGGYSGIDVTLYCHGGAWFARVDDGDPVIVGPLENVDSVLVGDYSGISVAITHPCPIPAPEGGYCWDYTIVEWRDANLAVPTTGNPAYDRSMTLLNPSQPGKRMPYGGGPELLLPAEAGTGGTGVSNYWKLGGNGGYWENTGWDGFGCAEFTWVDQGGPAPEWATLNICCGGYRIGVGLVPGPGYDPDFTLTLSVARCSVRLWAWGGRGGGSGGGAYVGGGGGGGAYSEYIDLPIVPGLSYYAAFDQSHLAPGGVAEDVIFYDTDGTTPLVLAEHGTNGADVPYPGGTSDGAAGVGGLAANCIGTTSYSGGDGADGGSPGGAGGGGAGSTGDGAAASGGTGGAGGTGMGGGDGGDQQVANGEWGGNFGGGGSGGTPNGEFPRSGGNNGSSRVYITWPGI